jgi:hypothetical protein
MSIEIRTTEYNCCQQHSLYNNTQNETTEETPFWANYEYNLKVWQEPQAHRSQSQKAILNIAEIKKLHKDLMNRIQQQTEQTTEIKPLWLKKEFI